ncbi:NUDIX hydrolase [Aeromicrobium sp. CTD01-1L150]|uniref:NUDIX hydrolase n=1 Tax=Aeromicrobium sp. CTD01-1L150 TaxID=3341830 RepID=UPI0035C07C78
MTLHADARHVLSTWPAPDEEQERLRLLYLEHLARHRDAMRRSCHPDHLTSSALVVDESRVLLVRHAKAGLWLQTGGHCEPGDATLADAALREATEESGISGLRIDPVPLRLSRHVVPACGPVRPSHHLDVQFRVVAPSGSTPVRQPGEDPVGWFAPDQLPEPTDEDVRALVSAAMPLPGGIPRP